MKQLQLRKHTWFVCLLSGGFCRNLLGVVVLWDCHWERLSKKSGRLDFIGFTEQQCVTQNHILHVKTKNIWVKSFKLKLFFLHSGSSDNSEMYLCAGGEIRHLMTFVQIGGSFIRALWSFSDCREKQRSLSNVSVPAPSCMLFTCMK